MGFFIIERKVKTDPFATFPLSLPNVLRHIKPCRILDVDGVFLFLLVVNMAYIVVAFVSFIIGYALCFKWFQQDIIEGKPIVFNKGIYVATKKKIEP